MNPKVTICMPTYNFARYLPEAIESVLSQSFTDFEFIIIDDGSTDRSAAILTSFAGKDTRIRAIMNAQNVGMVPNWNLCLSRATGEYIKFLFGDDKFESQTTLERMVDLMESSDDISLVASSRYVINEVSQKVCMMSAYTGEATYDGTDIIRDCIVEQKNKIGEPSAVMFRKKHGERGFDPRYRQIVDLEMWFHILEQGKFAFIADPLVSFRIHPQQQTRRNTLNPGLLDEPFLLLQAYSHKPYLRLSRVKREYMQYLPVYSAWKLYKTHGKISRRTAVEVIKKRYHLARFILLYPFFKLFKLYLSSFNR